MTNRRCSSLNAEGQPCGALAWRDGLCRWHHPDNAAALRESRRKGGQARSENARKSRGVAGSIPRDMAEVQALLLEAMAGVVAGTVPPRILIALSAGARAVAAIREHVDTDRRLAAIEAWLSEHNRGTA